MSLIALRDHTPAPTVLQRVVSWPLSALHAERERWFLWVPVAFAIGITGYFRLPYEPRLLICLLSIAAVASLYAILSRARDRAAPLRFVTASVLIAAAGFTVAKLRTEWVRAPVLPVAMTKAELSGRIAGLEGRADGGRRIWLEAVHIARLPADLTPARIVVYQRSAPETLAIGDTISLTADLRPPSAPVSPGGYDFARQNYFARIGAIAFTSAPIEQATSDGTARPASGLSAIVLRLEDLRRRIGQRIERALPGEVGAIAKALMTGERGAITTATNDAYRDAGIYHILSISGLHMAIMGGSVFFALRFCLAAFPAITLRYPIKKWAAVAAAIAALAYLLISGGAHATVRSFIMIVIMFLAILVDRPALALRNVAMAALAILIVAPESLFNAGFQLSFAAVTALVTGYEYYRNRQDRRRRLGLIKPPPDGGPAKWLHNIWLFTGATIATTILAGLATGPIAAFHFHHTQTYAIATNLMAVPLSNLVVMPAALAAFLAMPFSLEAYPLALMGLGIEGMNLSARWVASWPGAVFAVPAFSERALLVMLAGGLWLCLWRNPWRWLGLPVILAGAIIATDVPAPDVLVGDQGHLVAIRHEGRLSALDAPGTTFTLTRWLEADGDTRTPAEAQQRAGFRCDLAGCTSKLGEMILAVPRSPAALIDDCQRAAIIVLSFPRPPGCATTAVVLDRASLARDGAHAITLRPDQSFELTNVEQYRGVRPWTRAGLEAARQRYWQVRYQSGGHSATLTTP